MGSHLARYGVHPTSKLTGSNHTLLLWRHSFNPKNGFGEDLQPHLLSYLSECYDPHLNTSAI